MSDSETKGIATVIPIDQYYNDISKIIDDAEWMGDDETVDLYLPETFPQKWIHHCNNENKKYTRNSHSHIKRHHFNCNNSLLTNLIVLYVD